MESPAILGAPEDGARSPSAEATRADKGSWSDGPAVGLLLLSLVGAVVVFLPGEGRVAAPAHAWLALLLGRASFLVPLGLLLGSVTLLAHGSRPEAPLPASRFLGAGLLVVAALPAEHLLSGAASTSLAPPQGDGGTGLVGNALAGWLLTWLGAGGTAAALAALVLAGGLLAFGATPTAAAGRLRRAAGWCWRRAGRAAGRGARPAPVVRPPSRPSRPVAAWRLRSTPAPASAGRPPAAQAAAVAAVAPPPAPDPMSHGRLPLTLGQDAAGHAVVADLARMPHLLVAGGPRWPRSDCLDAMLAGLARRLPPDRLQLVVTRTGHTGPAVSADLPHLRRPLVTDAAAAAGALAEVVGEMDRRYTAFAEAGVRDLGAYEELAGVEPLPYIVVVVDDLAAVMAAAGPDGEDVLCRLAQLARATGIHLVVATASPDPGVITERIRRDVPTRLAFAVASEAASRLILDQAGAEQLAGPADALFLAVDAVRPVPVRLARGSDEGSATGRAGGQPELSGRREGDDEVYQSGVQLAERVGRVSVTLLQRRLGLDTDAARRLRARLIADGEAEA